MYRRILVAYNGAPESRPALEEATELGLATQAEVHVAAVMDTSAYFVTGEFVPDVALSTEQAHLEADLAGAKAMMAGRGVPATTHLVVGEPVDVIARLVNELGIDLLILGHPRTKSFALRWWRGSVDALLIERVRASILVACDPAKANASQAAKSAKPAP